MSDDPWTPGPLYAEVLVLAKTDYDRLNAVIQPLQARLRALKQVINATSDLLGEPIDEKYAWEFMKKEGSWNHAKRKRS